MTPLCIRRRYRNYSLYSEDLAAHMASDPNGNPGFYFDSQAAQNAGIAPDGTTTADSVTTPANPSRTGYVPVHEAHPGIYAGQEVVFSRYIKAIGNVRWAALDWDTVLVPGNPYSGVLYFDLVNGEVGGSDEPESVGVIEPAENGYWRCAVITTITEPVGAGKFQVSAIVENADNNTPPYTSNGDLQPGEGFLEWGRQFQVQAAGTGLLPYRKTTSVPA
jgi:hypothetical protein